MGPANGMPEIASAALVPIIAAMSASTSGFSDSTLMHRSLLDGTVELLPKPYQLEELARRVRALLDGKEENKRVPA